MSYFETAREAAERLALPLWLRADPDPRFLMRHDRVSGYAVDTAHAARFFHRLSDDLFKSGVPAGLEGRVLWVAGPWGSLEHLPWAVGLADQIARAGLSAYLSEREPGALSSLIAQGGRLPLVDFPSAQAVLDRPLAQASTDLQGVYLLVPAAGPEAPGRSPKPARRPWCLILADSLPESLDGPYPGSQNILGVVLVAGYRDHTGYELERATQGLREAGHRMLGLIALGPEETVAAPADRPALRIPAPRIAPHPAVPVLPVPPAPAPPPPPAPSPLPAPPPLPAPAPLQAAPPEPTPSAPPTPAPPAPVPPPVPVHAEDTERAPVPAGPSSPEGEPAVEAAPPAPAAPPAASPPQPAPAPPPVEHPPVAPAPQPAPPPPAPEPVPVERDEPATPSVPLLGAWHRHEERKGRTRRVVNGLALVAIALVILALGYGALRGFRGGARSRSAAVGPDTLLAESRVSPPAAGDSERALPGMVVPQAEPGDEEEETAIPEEAGEAPSSGGFGDVSPRPGAEEGERAGNHEERAPSDAGPSAAEPVLDPTRAATELAARRAARRDSLRLLRLMSREDSMRVALRSQVASDSFTASQSPAGSRSADSASLAAASPPADSLAPDTSGLAPAGRSEELPGENPVPEPLSAFLPARVDTFVVHLSSFRLLNEAETEVARFRSLGVDARYLRVPVEGMGTWYRVITGRFATFAQADSLALRLEAAGTIAHAHVIGKGGWGDPVPVTTGGAREQGLPGK